MFRSILHSSTVQCVFARNIIHFILSSPFLTFYGRVTPGPENHKFLRWISTGYPTDLLRFVANERRDPVDIRWRDLWFSGPEVWTAAAVFLFTLFHLDRKLNPWSWCSWWTLLDIPRYWKYLIVNRKIDICITVIKTILYSTRFPKSCSCFDYVLYVK